MQFHSELIVSKLNGTHHCTNFELIVACWILYCFYSNHLGCCSAYIQRVLFGTSLIISFTLPLLSHSAEYLQP